MAEAFAYLQREVAPRAGEIDESPEALREAIEGLASAGLLGLRVAPEYGGKGFSQAEFRRFQEECARCSGTLAFLQTQHQSACAMVGKSPNEDLKRRVLPEMASGRLRSGIAFSQLRRKGAEPMLRADRTDTGVVFDGKAPWLTGVGFFSHCVTAGTQPNGKPIFAMHRLDVPGLSLSEPMRLASMEPAQTVSAVFESVAIPNEDILYEQPENWIDDNDMLNIALQSPFALGCAGAALDIVAVNAERKAIPAIANAHRELSEKLELCREEAYGAMDNPEDRRRSLAARAWAIEMALRCAAAAVVSSSGAGNSMRHPAQRVYREALVFSVSAQTGAIMEATLNRLSSGA